MKKIKYIAATLLTVTLGGACSEQDINGYTNSPAVYFEMLDAPKTGIRDSLVFSFPMIQESTKTLDVRVRIMGLVADRDRVIQVGVDAQNSTATTENYDLTTEITLPAGAYETIVPVTVKRAGLTGKQVRLKIDLIANNEFQLGFERGHSAILVWGDKYIKPDNWDSSNYKNCFGDFTEAKMGIILQVCEISELPLPTDIYMLSYYNRKVREYLSENPQTDESGNLISIPVWNGAGGGLG